MTESPLKMNELTQHLNNCSHSQSKRALTALVIPLAEIVLLTVGTLIIARGFNPPNLYGISQWFTTWEFGFIKRGLIGTLITPLFQFKTGDEIHEMICLMGYGFLTLKLLLVAVLCRKMLRCIPNITFPVASVIFLVSAVFITSAHMTFTAHMSGYFDHILEAITIVSVGAVYREKFHWLPFLCITALFTHEMFAFYGLPVVGMAVLMKLYQRRPSEYRFPVALTTAIFGPVVVAGMFIHFAQTAYSPSQFKDLSKSISQYNAISTRRVDNMIGHLQESVVDSYEMQRHTKNRLTDGETAKATYPVISLFVIIGAILLIRERRWGILPIFVVTALLPLATNFIAWDGFRFAANSIFQSFVALATIILFSRMPLQMPRGLLIHIILLCIAVGVNNFTQPVPLMGGSKEYEGLLWKRVQPAQNFFKTCSPLFSNSTFDRGNFSNWSASGDIFQMKHKVLRSASLNRSAEGRYWLLSYSRIKDENGHLYGDRLTGQLISREFEIIKNRIIFKIAGGKDRKKTYVSLLIDGKEIHRSSADNDNTLKPRVWNVAKYRGKNARIEITDKSTSSWGHIDADQFCWSN